MLAKFSKFVFVLIFVVLVFFSFKVVATATYVSSAGVVGSSFSFDIGSAGTDRLVAVMAGNESSGVNLTGVTVDGKNCNLVTRANNIEGLGNHQEMWYCDEDDLGTSGGIVTVAIAGGDSSWAVQAHLYTSVSQAGPTDFGIDETSASVTTITVPNIDVPANGLVIMGAGNGLSGTWDSWTLPLIERTDGPNPDSSVLGTASGIETSAQVNKTYIATASVSFNRGTGIVAVWPEGNLSASLTANPSSTVNSSLLGVDLTASVGGSESAPTMNYYFWCDCNNSSTDLGTVQVACGTENLSVPAHDQETYNAVDLCDYLSENIYYAKTIVERGGYQTEDRTTVIVGFGPVGDGANGTYLLSSDDSSLGSRIQNIDFENFDGYLQSEFGVADGVTVVWRGEIYTPIAGIYNFRVNVNSTEYTSLYVGETEFWTGIGDQSRTINISKRWHSFWFMVNIPNTLDPDFDSQVQLYWTVPDGAEAIIPQNYLRSDYWADDILVIPDVLKARQPLEYLTTGVGSRNVVNPTIEVDIFDLTGDILKDEVLLFWSYSQDTDITVTNNTNGVSRNVAGIVATSESGESINVVYAKLPPELINNPCEGPNETICNQGEGNLSLTFTDVIFTRADGFVIIIPHIDIARPKGRISFRIDGRHIYGSSGAAGSIIFVFPAGDDVLINEDLRPLFIMGDGESKHLVTRRPNLIFMASGTGAPPDPNPAVNDLRDFSGVKIIVPEIAPSYPNDCLDHGNPDTWYPNYGREGQQLDVVSYNYVPNLWNLPDGLGATDYVAHPLEGGDKITNGTISSISINSEHTWVAFQYFSYDFDGECSAQNAESGYFIGGGLFARRSILEEPSPSAPLGLLASSSECEVVNLEWVDNSTNEDNFEVERSTNGGVNWTKIADVNGVADTGTLITYQDTAAVGDIPNNYRVRACHFEACSAWAE